MWQIQMHSTLNCIAFTKTKPEMLQVLNGGNV